MDNPRFIELKDGHGIIPGNKDELWLPLSELPPWAYRPETIKVADVYFEVIGFSESRLALLLAPIVIDGAADSIEQELALHIKEEGGK